jgi:hypothetical protein
VIIRAWYPAAEDLHVGSTGERGLTRSEDVSRLEIRAPGPPRPDVLLAVQHRGPHRARAHARRRRPSARPP